MNYIKYVNVNAGTIAHQKELRIEETEERIDYEKLKIEERILFYDEV